MTNVYYSDFYPDPAAPGVLGTTLPALTTERVQTIVSEIDLVAGDSILTRDEKIRTIIPLAGELETHYNELIAKAAAFSISSAGLTSARSAWLGYLNSLTPPWNDVSEDTAIVRTTIRDRLNSYVGAITALQNSLITEAARRADVDGGLTDNGAPIGRTAVVTSVGTSAAFAGQGSLATQNSVTALQVPYANIANSFSDEDFNTTLINPISGAAYDTTTETTTTLGVVRSIKSPIGTGKAPGAQNQFTTFSSVDQYVGVTAGGKFRFTGKSLVKAGFTGLLRQFIYFIGPTGASVGGPTVLTYVDRRGAAQVSTAIIEVDTQITVPVGAVRAYFIYFVDWSSSLTNAGYALVAKPGLRFVTDFAALTNDAVRFGSNVRQSDGVTVVTDATAVTSLGVAASFAGQTLTATTPLAGGSGYATNALALAALGVGKAYKNTTSGFIETTYSTAATGSGAKPLNGSTGSTIATSASVASVASGAFIDIQATFFAEAIDANTSVIGHILFEEGSGGTWATLGTEGVVINSNGGSLPGPSWSTDGSVGAGVRVFGARTGTVTYRATFVRTSGANLYGSNYNMSGAVIINAPAA